MDLDWDIDDDKIKSFLTNKLEEIKTKNEKLQLQLNDRRQFFKGLMESNRCGMDVSTVTISNVWKGIFNNKYAFIFYIENQDTECLEKIKIILEWNANWALNYEVTVYQQNQSCKPKCNALNCSSITDMLTEFNRIDSSGCLIVTLDAPKFIDQLSYQIKGHIIFQKNGRTAMIAFPPIIINSMDITTQEYYSWCNLDREINNLLMLISCNQRTDLVTILPAEWNTDMDKVMEGQRSFVNVNIPSSCRKYFVCQKLCPEYDGSLVVFHFTGEENWNVLSTIIYSRNEDCLMGLVHHLHKSLPGVIIIPKIFYRNYVHTDININDYLQKYIDYIKKERNFVEDFLEETTTYQGMNREDVAKFRSELASLEKQTDLLFQKICQINLLQ